MAAAIIVMMGWGAFEATRAFSSERAARDQATLSFSVLIEIQQAFAAVLNAETSQRGYLLTGKEDYLGPYASSRKDFRESISNLNDTLAGKATRTQSDLIARVQDLAHKRFDEISKTIEMARQGRREEALGMINTDTGQSLSENLRVIISQLESYEMRLLESSITRAEDTQERTVAILSLLAVGVIALVGILVFYVWQSVRLSALKESLVAVEAERAKTEILARELNHRVKNLFAIVLSLIRNTGRGETDVTVATTKIHERVHALSRAHELTATIDGVAATTIHELAEAVLSPYASDENRLSLDGPRLVISSKYVTPLGLILNELATNATKYGAWSREEGGEVQLEWTVSPDPDTDVLDVALEWEEKGGPVADFEQAEEKGFGSKLIELSAQQLDGRLDYDWNTQGVKIRIFFPVQNETIA